MLADREQRARFAGGRDVQAGRPEIALLLVRRDEQLRAGARAVEARDERDGLVGAQRSREPVEDAHQSSRSTNTWIVPPHVRPTEIASASLMPYVTSRGRPDAIASCASS